MQTSLKLSLALQECKSGFARQEELKELTKKREAFTRRSWAQKERFYNEKQRNNDKTRTNRAS